LGVRKQLAAPFAVSGLFREALFFWASRLPKKEAPSQVAREEVMSLIVVEIHNL
jgi:hypothetical protein